MRMQLHIKEKQRGNQYRFVTITNHAWVSTLSVITTVLTKMSAFLFIVKFVLLLMTSINFCLQWEKFCIQR